MARLVQPCLNRVEMPAQVRGELGWDRVPHRRVKRIITNHCPRGRAWSRPKPRAPSPRFAKRNAAPSEFLARLLEASDLSVLLREIVRGARTLTRARSAELVLWRQADPLPRRVLLGRQSTQPLESHPALRRVQAGRTLFTREGRGASILAPLRHGTKNLGCVRIEWSDPPSQTRLAKLRPYLAHAGAALARIVTEGRLLNQHRRYEALLGSLPDACLLIVSPRGVVLSARGHAEELFGVPRASLQGNTLATSDGRRALLRMPRTRLRQLFAAAGRSEKAQDEAWIRRPGRADIQVQLTLVDLGSGGEFVCVLRDLTEVRAMELALRRRNNELTRAAERLREVDLLKNEFMSNVSHELRTPLTAIIAYSESLLLTPPDADTQRQFLRVIADQGHKLQRLITGLLDIAKIESLATELKLEPTSLNDVVLAALETVRPQADKNHIVIATSLHSDLPVVYLDELRVQQIVWNLLSNAIKFSPPKSTVRISTWFADRQVWASIQDAGIGIAPEHQKLIFEKFVQVDGSSTRRHGGVGLGLDLVKHLVELHGGQVRVESSPGNGSCFYVSIPVEKRGRPRMEAKRVQRETVRGAR